MSDLSTRLELPYLLPSQAQKHVTHNEAIQRLDLLVQLTVEEFDGFAPPEAPEEGQIWALGANPVGAWAGQGMMLAAWLQEGWIFITPKTGWHVSQGNDLRVWTGSEWAKPDLGELSNLQGLGINSSYDSTNRLTVSSTATLLNNEGAGHQLKINKAADTDTASLLFQTNWSGRAEMGTAGNDDFSIKLSADGQSWHNGAVFDAATGKADFPNGLSVGMVEISGAVTGLAVSQSITDTTVGRLLRADHGYSRGNVVGSVSMTGGTPSGAVIERGTNANGTYIRFADGTQICMSYVTMIYVNAWSLSGDCTYPAAFTELTHCDVTYDGDNLSTITPSIMEIGWIGGRFLNLTSLRAQAYRIQGRTNFTSTDYASARVIVIGRWA